MGARTGMILLAGAINTACFGARSLPKNYYVLHGEYVTHAEDAPTISGHCRVETLDAESVYEKFQLVVRRSPYELSYSDNHVWAVKPNQQVTDIFARALSDGKIFSSVSTEIGGSRPKYSVAGEIQAIELFDSGDVWYAHLSMSLRLVQFSDGERLWRFDYAHRKPIEADNYAHGVRALSEMLAEANTMAVKELETLARSLPNEPRSPDPVEPLPPAPRETYEPILIPETRSAEEGAEPAPTPAAEPEKAPE